MRTTNGLGDGRRDIHGVEHVVGALFGSTGLREGVGDDESFYGEGLEGSHRGGGEKTCEKRKRGRVSKGRGSWEGRERRKTGKNEP